MSLDLLMIAADSAKAPAALKTGSPTLQQMQRQQKMQLLLQQQQQQLPHLGMGLVFPGASSSCFVPKLNGQLLPASTFQPFAGTLLPTQQHQQNLTHSGSAVAVGRSCSASGSTSAEVGHWSDSGGTEDSVPQKSQRRVEKVESPPTPVTSASNIEGPHMKRRKLNQLDADEMLLVESQRQEQARIQQGHHQQLMLNHHQHQQKNQFLNNQLQMQLLQLHQQNSFKQHFSQGSCFVQDTKKTKRKRKCVESPPVATCAPYPLMSSMAAPAQSVQFVPTGLLAEKVRPQVTGVGQGQVISNVGSAGVQDVSSMLHNSANKSAKHQTTMEQQYAMALNNMNAMISIGGNQVKKAETRRREQRRLSAQRRRERKRCNLSYLEEKVCKAKKEQAQLSEQLSKHLEEDAGDTTQDSRAATQKVLDDADKSILKPTFPVWKSILEKARKETMQGDTHVLDDDATMKKTLTKDISEADKLKIRRERNRISARMSRLRKRLRQNYLEETFNLLSKKIALMKSALHAGGVQMNQVSSD